MEFNHELIVPNEDLPFKVFIFEGREGNYFRDAHWHRSIEIFAVFEGSLTFYINKQKYPLHPGQFVLVNSNEIHSIDSPAPNLTVVIQIPLKTFENYYTGQQFISFTHDAQAQDEKVMSLISRIYETYSEKKCGYDLRVQGLFYELLYQMVTKYRETEVSQDMLRKNRKLNRLSVITSYVKEHYTEELSLERLGGIFGYSPTYLSRMFQKYAGINYKSYLQNIRMEYALKELLNTEYTISEIALANGFPNSKAMAKVFRKKYGILPSEFRKRQESDIV
ncbi:AraC family transcriptional regulator [Faecalicatena contorta]|jgi:AraC-like DNA-binding protein/quercetin dioxygenase-like cupin family protein|uniref:AraC-type DNA-binding protein n=1 Tax=Faecalicatena contorta TaxID=39482 RepID=A0A315ZYJ5_9FIRM|nr:AraC family transcriptional regulator [Faecalicatena contorta]PWJ50565.1 AraC-like DNA-binding protein [Faecalicatena contorta]SUQ13973.1 AraC-type DNA-binding protein [Faecalicatena contorta]